MQVKMFFEEGDRLIVQMGDNPKDRKGVEWEQLQKATEDEPTTVSFSFDPLMPRMGDPKMREAESAGVLDPTSLRPLGERPMVEQDRHFREASEKKEEKARLDEEAELEKARQAAENETAERTEGERYQRSRKLREKVSEAQSEALDEAEEEREQEEAEEQEEFRDEAGEGEQVEEEDVPVEEEEVIEEEPEEEVVEEEKPTPRRGGRAATKQTTEQRRRR